MKKQKEKLERKEAKIQAKIAAEQPEEDEEDEEDQSSSGSESEEDIADTMERDAMAKAEVHLYYPITSLLYCNVELLVRWGTSLVMSVSYVPSVSRR